MGDRSRGVAAELVEACRGAWQPNRAGSRLAEAIALREAIYRLFAATAANLRLPETDLAALNEALGEGPPRSHLSDAEAQCRWQVDAPKPALATLLAPVLWSAGDLLTGPSLARVRICANTQCRQLFLDDDKTGNRRWCTMSSYDNRAKAQRHYLKHRKAN